MHQPTLLFASLSTLLLFACNEAPARRRLRKPQPHPWP